MVKMFDSIKIGLFVAFSILSTSIKESAASEKTEYEVVLEKYEDCEEGHNPNILFKSMSLDHGKNQQVLLTFNCEVQKEIKGPVSLDANMEMKDNEAAEWAHYMNPKVENFCENLHDEDDLFTQILHEMGVNMTECPIKPNDYKIKNKKFNVPPKAMETLKSHEFWRIFTVWHSDDNDNDEMCTVLYLKRVEKNKKQRKRN